MSKRGWTRLLTAPEPRVLEENPRLEGPQVAVELRQVLPVLTQHLHLPAGALTAEQASPTALGPGR